MKSTVFIISFLFISLACIAQVKITIEAPYFQKIDTLELRLWEDYVGYRYNIDHRVLKAGNENGKYNFEFKIEGLNWLDLHLDYQKSGGNPSKGVLENFLVAADDSLIIRLLPKEAAYQGAMGQYENGWPIIPNSWQVRVDGRGKEKFEAKLFLDSLVGVGIQGFRKGGLQSLQILADFTFETLKDRLKQYEVKPFLETNILAQEILIANALGTLLESLTRNLKNGNFKEMAPSYLPFVIFDESAYSQAELYAISKSPQYQSYLEHWFLLKSDLKFKNANNAIRYQLIKDGLTYPSLRAKVATSYLMKRFQYETSDSLLIDIRSWVKEGLSMQILDRLGASTKGKQVDFSLPDAANMMHHRDEFLGKVVLVDFWYMGCMPCRAFMKNILGPVAERFKNDKRFEIITISIDNFSDFQNAVGINDFLPPRALHLYTDNQKSKHPLVKNLGINSYPRPFLLNKEGKIVATKGDMVDLESIIKLIEQEL